MCIENLFLDFLVISILSLLLHCVSDAPTYQEEQRDRPVEALATGENLVPNPAEPQGEER